MSNLQCNKCQNHMQMQSESLTEEFWVCTNTECNKWERRSSVSHEVTSSSISIGLGEAIYSIFNKRVFNSPLLRMMFDTEKTTR
jgi:hypothetical protein